MTNQRVSDSFVAISDFHAMEWPLEKVKDYYLNEYEKIFILGDATDRGENGEGKNGIEILEEIMELSKKYPGRVIYVPGNHDELLYNYAKSGAYFYKHNLEVNGGQETVRKIEQMKESNPDKFDELMDWLGSQPLQRVHHSNGKKFVFAHAFFNQKIYDQNPSFALKDLYHFTFGTKEYKKPGNILWYRKGRSSNFEEVSIAEVPTDAIMVIGHTPECYRQGTDLSLNNKKGTKTPVFCVDGGVSYGDQMLKYDGQNSPIHTEFGIHRDTSPKQKGTTSKNETEDALDIMNYAVLETAAKYGVSQAKRALTKLISGAENWPYYFSGENRDKIRSLGEENIKNILLRLSGEEKDLNAGVNKYIKGMFGKLAECEDATYDTEMSFNQGTAWNKETIDGEMNQGMSWDKYCYELTRSRIIQDDLSIPSKEMQIYSLRKSQIIQDDLGTKTYTSTRNPRK